MSDFGKWLAAERSRARMTGEELAASLQTSQGTVSSYETGIRKPRPDRIREIAAALGSDVNAGLLAAGYAPPELTREPIFDPSRFEGYDELSPEFRDEVAEDIELATEIAIRRAREKQRRQGQGE